MLFKKKDIQIYREAVFKELGVWSVRGFGFVVLAVYGFVAFTPDLKQYDYYDTATHRTFDYTYTPYYGGAEIAPNYYGGAELERDK